MSNEITKIDILNMPIKHLSLDAPIETGDESKFNFYNLFPSSRTGVHVTIVRKFRGDFCEQVRNLVSKLPKKQREIVQRFYGLPPYKTDYGLSEIAKIMQMPENSVRKRRWEALRLLRKHPEARNLLEQSYSLVLD